MQRILSGDDPGTYFLADLIFFHRSQNIMVLFWFYVFRLLTALYYFKKMRLSRAYFEKIKKFILNFTVSATDVWKHREKHDG